VEIVQHVAEDTLEQYSMQTLSEAEAEPVEKHLLMCRYCRDQLVNITAFVTAMLGAAAKIREDEQV